MSNEDYNDCMVNQKNNKRDCSILLSYFSLWNRLTCPGIIFPHHLYPLLILLSYLLDIFPLLMYLSCTLSRSHYSHSSLSIISYMPHSSMFSKSPAPTCPTRSPPRPGGSLRRPPTVTLLFIELSKIREQLML